MKHRKSIALIGFRATGKTLVGRLLSEKCRLRYADMDEILTTDFSMTIREWVEHFGWESFREAESRLLLELAEAPPLVVATGGGVVLLESNRQILAERFHVVWLQASCETIHERIREDRRSHSQRPALSGLPLEEEIRELLGSRLPLYRQVAHLTLWTDKEPVSNLVDKIISFLVS